MKKHLITTAILLREYSLHITIILLAVMSLYPLFTAIIYPHHFLNDDSFITLTYSKNIALGRGFIFNHPPATLGTTTPLFALIIAFLSKILPNVEIPVIAVFFTTFCWIGIVWIFFIFRHKWQIPLYGILIIAFVFYALGWIKFLGMEAYPFALLLTLSISLFLSDRLIPTGFVAGLLFLTRGEGILILLVFFIATYLKYRTTRDFKYISNSIFKILTSFAIPTLLWFLFAYSNFGVLLPNTLSAKQAQGQNNVFNTFFIKLVNWLPTWFKQFEIFYPINISWILVPLGLIVALRRNRQWLMWVGWMAFYVIGYSILGVAAYAWYFLPIVFVLNLLLSLGIIQVISFTIEKINNLLLKAAFLSFFTVISVWTLIKPMPDYGLLYEGDPRAKSYINLSHWFNRNAKPDESIAYIEIGYLGYYTDNKIIDLAGLVLSDIVFYVSKGDFTSGFWKYRPDYYVYLPDFDWALAGIRADPRFDLEYQAVATLLGPRENNFTIYKRRSLLNTP